VVNKLTLELRLKTD